MRLTFTRQERAIAEWHLAAIRERHEALHGDGREAVVRQATSADTHDILNLIATSYNRETSSPSTDYWQWKHEANPFGASPCLVAESNGRLVGVRVFLRWNWYSESHCIRTARAVDTATHPDWRGKGVFSRLTMQLVEQMQKEGVSFIYNTPNANSMPGYLKMGWAPVTRIPLWIRPTHIAALAGRTLSGIQATAPVLDEFGTVAEVLNDPRLPAFLADVTPNDTRYHTAHTPGYLRWRYRDVPGIFYGARLETAGDAGALVIARGRVRGRLREVTISELLVTPSTRGARVARMLLSELIDTADTDYVAACAASGTTARQALARVGFLPAPCIGPHFTTRRLSSVGLDPSRWASWRCSIGDLELF